jgi:hypothetical protein
MWVKDETHNVAGSHKARHLMGLLLYLAVVEGGPGSAAAPGAQAPLAIASCGNAALGAAVLARAASRALQVYVPPDAEHAVLDRLAALARWFPRANPASGTLHGIARRWQGVLPLLPGNKTADHRRRQTLVLETLQSVHADHLVCKSVAVRWPAPAYTMRGPGPGASATGACGGDTGAAPLARAWNGARRMAEQSEPPLPRWLTRQPPVAVRVALGSRRTAASGS